MGVVLDTPWDGTTFNPPTPLDIATIESAILAQLRSQISTIEITHYPDRPETYRLTHRVGAALIRYDGATYGSIIDTGAVVQKRELRFAVRVIVRDLGWSLGGDPSGTTPGAYGLLESIRSALTGFQIGGCSKMHPVLERFVERDRQGGVWIYESIYALTTAAVEPSTTDNFPLFVKGLALEEGGQTGVAVAAGQYAWNENREILLPQTNISALTVTSVSSGTIYTLNADYTVDNVNGVIGWLVTGTIPLQDAVSVAYTYADVVIAIAGSNPAPTATTN
jgi:hypothetical protein